MGRISININKDEATKYLTIKQQKWTLVVGAGICRDILPDWSVLTKNVYNRCFGTNLSIDEFHKTNASIGFSYDSWIQASLNKHILNGHNEESFNNILEEELYGDLLKKADSKGMKTQIINFLVQPKTSKEKLQKIIDFFKTEFGHTTVYKLADVLSEDPNGLTLPGAIITFNADPLLHSLICGLNIIKHSTTEKPIPVDNYKHAIKSYVMWGDKIPVFHLHGCLMPNAPHKTKKKVKDSRGNLIFLESSYTRVASNMYSWAQTNFLYYATNSNMVFIGLSMSDPNIRKWLNWACSHLNQELIEKNKGKSFIAQNHIWIKAKPKVIETVDFFESSLIHLGVKTAWLDSYNDIETGLRKMMQK